MSSAYSLTPLARKLGIKAGFKMKIVNAPKYYFELFNDMPEDIEIDNDSRKGKHFIHFFTADRHELETILPRLKQEIIPSGIIWVSWPKKTSRMATTVDENMVRHTALAIGLVDVKVCAVDEVWSGLKLVIPVKDRVANLF
jgi:hypothetical protein